MNKDKAMIVLASTVVVGVGTLFFTLRWLWAKKKAQPPKQWRKVGEITEIFIFPVKSSGGIRLDQTDCTILGCKSGWLRDRSLMVVDAENRCFTARKCSRMVKIISSISGSILSLSAPGMTRISVDLSKVEKKLRAQFRQDIMPSNDCGDAVAKWLSTFILKKDSGLRLVYYTLNTSLRTMKKIHKGFHRYEASDIGVYSDESSFTLINQASFDDLSTRLDEPVDPRRFRLNFTVKGPQAYEEDTWDWIKIGSVIFRNVRPCVRCIFTTISPETGEKHPKMEPLNTLKKYRKIEDPAIKPMVGSSPALGIHLGLKGPEGIVEMGDPVFVGTPDEN